MKTTIFTIVLFALTIDTNAQECKTPQIISAFSTSDRSAIITWLGDTDSDEYIISYRLADSIAWNKVSNSSPGILLNDLQPCKKYEYKVISRCKSSLSNSSATKSFITAGCKEAATCGRDVLTGYTVNVTEKSAFLVWDLTPGVTYRLNYRNGTNETWNQYETKLNFSIMFGLSECTNYQWYIDVVCPNGTTNSNSNAVNNFKTNCAEFISNSNLHKIEEEFSYNLYPNPAQNFISISSKEKAQKSESEILIFDFYGRLIKNVGIFTKRTTINIEDLPAGMYLVQIMDETQTVHYSFTKAN